MTLIYRRAFPRIEFRDGDKVDAWNAGANGQNNMWRLWAFTRIDAPLGTMMQELLEWRWRAGWTYLGLAGLFAGAIASLVETDPAWMLLALLLAPAMIVSAVPAIRRDREWFSHAVTHLVGARCYGLSIDAQDRRSAGLNGESGGLAGYPWFRGVSREKLYEGLVARRRRAERYLARPWNAATLERLRAFEAAHFPKPTNQGAR